MLHHCHSLGYKRNALANVASLDASHEEGGPEGEEMLQHHWKTEGMYSQCTGIMSAELLSHGCNRVRVMQQMATNCPQEETLEFKAMLQDDFALNSRERCISPTACCEILAYNASGRKLAHLNL